MKNFVLCIVCICLILYNFNIIITTYAQGNTCYVSATNGNDSTGDGTLNNPWKTIQRAADVLQAGDTCVIREGTYRETIIPANSGSEGKPIKFQGYAGETATISGTVPIANWQQHSGNIYKVNIPSSLNLGKNNQLFANSKMMTEARWPNDTDGDPFTFEGFDMDETDGNFIKASALTQPDGYWNGATLVYGSGSNNAVRSVSVTNYSQQEKKLSYNAEGSPKPRIVGTKVYLLGRLEELDSPGEWFYDETSSTLYFWAHNNANPNDINVEIKNKKYAFNLSDRSHIEIKGINIFGSTIYGNNTNSLTIDRINAKYLMHRSVPGPLNTWKDEMPKGLTILGNNNTIKNSEIAYSAFGGIDMNGKNINIVNNLIHHINYRGTSVGAIWLEGRDYLISHNTVHTTSRAILGIYSLQKSVIQYNRLYNGGIMGNDFGLINNGKIDGWNTEIHHNVIYENVGTHVPVGIYLDNQHSNFILHHNVVWGINPDVIKNNALRLNIESFNTLVYNNTFIGGFADQYGGTTCENIMTGDRMANNIFTQAFNDHPDIVKNNNIYPDVDPKFVDATNNNYRLSSTSPAIDAGIEIKGVTDGYKGKAPDIGAFEYEGEDWTLNVGHNFENPPNPELVFNDFKYMNRVKNAGFDEERWINLAYEYSTDKQNEWLNELGDGLSEWTKTGTETGTETASVSYAAAPTSTIKNTRYTNTSHHALKLGSGQNGVEQLITDLTPNTTYNISGWLRADEGEEIRIGVKDFGGEPKYETTAVNVWQNKNISFVTGATNTSATVYLWKESNGLGNAYADDLSLIYSDRVNLAEEIIIDNTDSGFSSDSPWIEATITKGFYGRDYFHVGTASADQSKWAKWTPEIVESGQYSIYIRWTAGSNRPAAAPIEVAYNGGVDTTKTVNQQENNGVWMFLGRYDLLQGASNHVKIFASDIGYTIADAVKFVKVEANKYYVSEKTGNDSTGDGTINNPWKTIQRAADVLQGGGTCIIRGGTYRETVIPANSGSEGKPIKFVAYPDEKVTVSGTETVSGWEQHNSHIYKATMNWDMGKYNQIFADGKMMLEARWPNDEDGDMNTLTGYDVVGGTLTSLTSEAFTQSNDYWNGAMVWFAGGHSPSSAQSGIVTDYDSKTKTVHFNELNFAPDGTGKKFYMVGKLSELDTAGEWYFDKTTSLLYLWAPSNADPNDLTVEAKSRRFAFDISDRSYIEIEGVNVFGATIYGINTSNSTLKEMNIKYLMHMQGPGVNLKWAEEYPNGLKLLGDNNTVRDCEISDSALYGLYMSGRNLKVVNNLIYNMAYSGASVSGLWCMGYGNLISNNTIHTCGRHVYNLRKTQASVIQYNRIYGTGEFSSDSGVVSSHSTDGWNTEFHHNIIYNNKGVFTPSVLYLDNYHSNFTLHHNVVWGSAKQSGIANPNEALRLNTESTFTLLYNNTFDGRFATIFPIYRSMEGDIMANNIFTDNFSDVQDIFKEKNMYSETDPMFTHIEKNDYTLQANSPAIDAGTIVEGINDNYKGESPDIGAFEYGEEDWTLNAGHNFENPPMPELKKNNALLYINRVQNAGFEEKFYLEAPNSTEEGLTFWEKTGTKTAIAKDTSDRRQGWGILQLGSGTNGVEQKITGLRPNTTYSLVGWLKSDGATQVRLGVKDYGKEERDQASTFDNWSRKSLSFTTGADSTSATIYIQKETDNDIAVYADNIALVYENDEKAIVIDNNDAGFAKSENGWAKSDATSGYYGNDYYQRTGSESNKEVWAKWSPDIKESGTYEVYIRWVIENELLPNSVASAFRPSKLSVEIKGENEAIIKKTINQTRSGGYWISLGKYNFNEDEENYIKISCDALGIAVADAVKFEKKKDMTISADAIIVDDLDKGFTDDGYYWEIVKSDNAYQGTYLRDGTDSETNDINRWAKWTPNIKTAGFYDIYMYYPKHTSFVSEAPLVITHKGGVDVTKKANQKTGSNDWVFVGKYELTEGKSNSVKILCDTPGRTVADAFKFVPINVKPSISLTGDINLFESKENDGTIKGNKIVAKIKGDKFKQEIMQKDITISNLPKGMIIKDVDLKENVLTFSVGGKAEKHNQSNDISKMYVTIKKEALEGGKDIVSTQPLSMQFFDSLVNQRTKKEQILIGGIEIPSNGKVYDGKAMEYVGTVKLSNDEYVGNVEFVWSSKTVTKDVGKYTLTVKIPDSDPKYSGSITLPFSITQRNLTIRACNAIVGLNDKMPTLNYKVKGLVEGESLIRNPNVSSRYARTVAEGTYKLTVSGALADENYNPKIVYEIGYLYVLPSYTVDLVAGSNGSISPSGKIKKIKNSLINVSIKPDFGYEIGSVIANGEKVSVENNKFTLRNITTDIKANVVFIPLKEDAVVFEDIVVDNTSPGFSTSDENWKESTSAQMYYGSNYLHDNTSGSDQNRWAMWKPTITESGKYDVYFAFPIAKNASTSLDVDVGYNGGVKNFKNFANQRNGGGSWLYLGEFEFAQNSDNYVKIYCNSAGFTVADAVNFVYKGK